MIEEKVIKMLKAKEWTFADLQNMSGVVEEFTDKLYEELSANSHPTSPSPVPTVKPTPHQRSRC